MASYINVQSKLVLIKVCILDVGSSTSSFVHWIWISKNLINKNFSVKLNYISLFLDDNVCWEPWFVIVDEKLSRNHWLLGFSQWENQKQISYMLQAVSWKYCKVISLSAIWNQNTRQNWPSNQVSFHISLWCLNNSKGLNLKQG